jgi:hypothetical protein
MADWNGKIHETTEKAEEELKRLIAYLNDEVVPDVRRHSVAGLRSAAEALQALAQKMEENGRSR